MRVLYSFLLSFLVLLFVVKETVGSQQVKRSTAVIIPSLKTLLSCDRGRMSIECSPSSSVYVSSAIFGSIENVNICVRGGNSRAQTNCSSPHTLHYARSSCLGKTRCQFQVNEEVFGFAVTREGGRCPDAWKHLSLKYKCVPDCKPPRYHGGVSVIGNQFSFNSNLTVKCRSGYAPLSDKSPVNQITCGLNGLWSGGSITCKDINECASEQLNNCDLHADCINAAGGYTCRCGEGYFGDGFTCNAADADQSWMEPLKNMSYEIETDSNCGGKLFKTSGLLESPNYPSLYPNSANCEWVLSVPPSKVIELEFTKFHLEGPVQGRGCIRDYITVYDGPLQKPRNWLATYCGKEKPSKVRSTLNQMRIEFKTDPEASYTGFQVLYRSLNPLAVCKNFMAPDYPGVIIIQGVRNETANAGDLVLLGCDVGFKVKQGANLQRVCQNDMTWNDVSNPCSAVRCDAPRQYKDQGIQLNGSETDYHYMAKPLMYRCNNGYILKAGPGMKKVISCNKQGRWSNEDDDESPMCEKIQCEITDDMIPPQHADWRVNQGQGTSTQAQLGLKVPYNSFVEYYCIKGYTLVGDTSRVCIGVNNRWSGRTMLCEEDNGVPGLSNFQLAIIISCASGALILIVGGLLLYCCIAEKKRKEHQIKRTNERAQNNGGSYYRPMHQNYHPMSNSGFLWSPPPQTSNNGKINQSYNDGFQKKVSSVDVDKNRSKRPYMLPSVVTPITPIWTDETHATYGVSLEGGNKESRSNFQPYSAAQVPTNRPKDSYAKYQKKFKRSR